MKDKTLIAIYKFQILFSDIFYFIAFGFYIGCPAILLYYFIEYGIERILVQASHDPTPIIIAFMPAIIGFTLHYFSKKLYKKAETLRLKNKERKIAYFKKQHSIFRKDNLYRFLEEDKERERQKSRAAIDAKRRANPSYARKASGLYDKK